MPLVMTFIIPLKLFGTMLDRMPSFASSQASYSLGH